MSGILKQEAAMPNKDWIECEDSNFQALNVHRCDTIYVRYRGTGNYCVFAAIGSRDLLIKSGIGSQRDAEDMVRNLIGLT
jgi:hypothetical protein